MKVAAIVAGVLLLVVAIVVWMLRMNEPETRRRADEPPLGVDSLTPAEPPAVVPSPAIPYGASPSPLTRDESARFRCVGNEPGWTLAISRDSLVFVGDYGEVRASYPAVVPRTGDGMWYYETANRSGPSEYSHLTVMVVRGPCSDGMSDKKYDYTVRVIHDSKNYVGCGQRL